MPLQYIWSPAEFSPTMKAIVRDAILDFGRVIEGDEFFSPTLYAISKNFRGFVRAADAVRFGLQIVAENFQSAELQIFEVAWNGQWSDKLDEMEAHLRIREMPPAELSRGDKEI